MGEQLYLDGLNEESTGRFSEEDIDELIHSSQRITAKKRDYITVILKSLYYSIIIAMILFSTFLMVSGLHYKIG